ncbi:YolD-like family protein [Neobacillus drentensis]|uniref:YolD-like family protein n=1 Tax=Neobacillus drentensis TaxID=220684 RepID=UPI002FFF578A
MAGSISIARISKTQKDFWLDTERERKPIIDKHEAEEFDLRIIYAMEFNHSVKLTIWADALPRK